MGWWEDEKCHLDIVGSSCGQTLTSSPRKLEQGVSSPLSLLAPTMHHAVIMTHGSQYEGKTTLPLRQRRSRNPQHHLFSAPLESSGMASPAGKLGNPWSWARLLSGEHRWVALNYLLCSARGWMGMYKQVLAYSVKGKRRERGDKQRNEALRSAVENTIKKRKTGRGPSPAWDWGQSSFLGVLPGPNLEGPIRPLSEFP